MTGMERRNPICDWVTSNLCLSIKTALAAKMTAPMFNHERTEGSYTSWSRSIARGGWVTEVGDNGDSG